MWRKGSNSIRTLKKHLKQKRFKHCQVYVWVAMAPTCEGQWMRRQACSLLTEDSTLSCWLGRDSAYIVLKSMDALLSGIALQGIYFHLPMDYQDYAGMSQWINHLYRHSGRCLPIVLVLQASHLSLAPVTPDKLLCQYEHDALATLGPENKLPNQLAYISRCHQHLLALKEYCLNAANQQCMETPYFAAICSDELTLSPKVQPSNFPHTASRCRLGRNLYRAWLTTCVCFIVGVFVVYGEAKEQVKHIDCANKPRYWVRLFKPNVLAFEQKCQAIAQRQLAMLALDKQKKSNRLAWMHTIVKPFKESVLAFFPFNPQGDNLSVSQLARFFQLGQGLLWDFQPEKPTARWQSLRRFSQTLFQDKPNLALKILPSPDLGEVQLKIANKRWIYRNGPLKQVTLRWPHASEVAEVSLMGTDPKGRPAFKVAFDGPWGLIHLLRKAKVEYGADGWLRFEWHIKNKRTQKVYESRLQMRSFPNAWMLKTFLTGKLSLPYDYEYKST